MNTIMDIPEGVLMPRREDIEHDFTTIASYPDHVALECTCGFHAPPVGLAENPMVHVEHCEDRTNRLRLAVNATQRLID